MSKAYICNNCLKFYRGKPAFNGDNIDLCPNCMLLVKHSRNIKPYKSTSKTVNVKISKKKSPDINPYPKYSYNSGLCDENGPVYGLDFDWQLYELAHGRSIDEDLIKFK